MYVISGSVVGNDCMCCVLAELDPNNYMTFYRRATVYLAMGKSKSALPDLDVVLSLKPDFNAVCWLFQALAFLVCLLVIFLQFVYWSVNWPRICAVLKKKTPSGDIVWVLARGSINIVLFVNR